MAEDRMRHSSPKTCRTWIARTLPAFLCVTLSHADPLPPNQPYPENGPFYFENFAPPPPSNLSELKIVSYNVNFSRRPERIAETLREVAVLADADIILLQEVTGPIGGAENGAQQIARILGMNYVYSPGMVFRGTDYGNAILSRFPLRNFQKAILAPSTLESITRTAITAEATVDGKPFVFASVHLSTLFADSLGRERQRVEQLRGALALLPSDPTHPALFGGDLNTFRRISRRNVHAELAKDGFIDAHPTSQWTMRYLHTQLDHLFSRGGLTPVEYGVAYEANASDHVPIWSRIKLP
jgi:endonuclease/exonuclease/phosphatase family metal-dependent hydrolase